MGKNPRIKGVLDWSLYNEVLLQLGMEERLGAVEHPCIVQVRMPDRPNRTLPAGISIIEIFHEMNGAMLILGEPGSGKTTILLELARDCIDLAEQEEDKPIPVVFNLSSWEGSQTIDKWLVDELQTKYSVGKDGSAYCRGGVAATRTGKIIDLLGKTWLFNLCKCESFSKPVQSRGYLLVLEIT